MKKNTVIILLLITVIALFIRFYLLPSHLFFGPEQGRDMLVIRDIVVNHKLTLIGSKTDISGIFHGPIFYYLAALPFAVTQGNPLAVAAFFIFFQALTVVGIYLLVYELTNKKRPSYIASSLYAVSFLAIVYARWFSNPPLSIPLSVLFFLCLIRFMKGKSTYLLGIALCYGLLGQAEFINYLMFGAIGLIFLGINWKRIIKTPLWILATSLLAGVGAGIAHYILFDLRHEFLIFKGITGLIAGRSGIQLDLYTSFYKTFGMFFDQIAVVFGVFYPYSGIVIGITVLVIVCTYIRKREYQMILVWIVVPPVFLAFLRHIVLEQLFVGSVAGIIVAGALCIEWVYTKKKLLGIIVFSMFLVTNILCVFRYLPVNDKIFFLKSQFGTSYTNELSVVHAVYKRAAGRPFYFQSFTFPVFWQDGWTYLFWYIGTKTYGYTPVEEDKSIIYVIIPTIYNDPLLALFQKNWYEKTVSTWGIKTNEERIGTIMIEERTIK